MHKLRKSARRNRKILRFLRGATSTAATASTVPTISSAICAYAKAKKQNMTWDGNYTSVDRPGALFEVKKSDMKTNNTYTPMKTMSDFETPEEFLKWLLENNVVSVWFEVRAEVYHNYTHVVWQPTNAGNDWGSTRTYQNDPEQRVTLRLDIYANNMVKKRGREEFTGTLAKRLG
ncbi:MAG: hypothetical protein FWH48_00495 [Oscillospiraceae bacterium]|nr:hypothetical protein [Oscillospiraceae bacterium]